MQVSLKNYRQSPSKVRLVANAIRGKKVDSALQSLTMLNKKSSMALHKLIMSGVNQVAKEDVKDMKIKSIRVNEGVILRRMRPRARGSAYPIKKRSSTVIIELE